jgi:phage terminase small subunit
MPDLTQKQESFCLTYIETGNASEAYRRAYSVENMKPETVNRNAKALMDSSKISTRVAELQAANAVLHEITVESIRVMLMEDRAFARKCKTPGAAVTATMGLAKLYGHLTEKVDARIAGIIGMPIVTLARQNDAG